MRNFTPRSMRLLALVAGAAASPRRSTAKSQERSRTRRVRPSREPSSRFPIRRQASNERPRPAESGLYRFTLLPLGSYDLLGQAVGFADAHRSGVTVNAGVTVTVNISLQIAGASTAIDVSAATAITDPSRTDLGSTLNRTQLRTWRGSQIRLVQKKESGSGRYYLDARLVDSKWSR